ncbi:immunoglobulin domain-containing protein, partial [Flavobacterium sp.]|uniref:immunoglobulin domain-containing protein n=1 Tax=Flavobacterium sp. TaxID=239 RepID=UPI003FA60895
MNRKLLLFYCIFLCPFLQVSAQNFGTFASAVWLTDCNTSNFFNTTGEGANLIGPPANVFTNTNFGVFIQNSGTFILRGGEVKTFKNSNGNVCSVRMRYRIYLASASPGAFNTIDFPFFNDCNSAINEFPSGGPCGAGDQKWQRVIANGTTNPYSPVDLTANSPGDYVLEVFYEVTGDFNSASECDDNLILNASGNNYKAFFTVRSNPTFTFTNPTTCNGSDGSITISNLNPNSVYTFSYRDDGVQISPTLINTNSSGSYTLNLLNSGSYSTFNFVINNCSTTINGPVVLTDPIVNPPSSNGDQEVCETNPFQTLTASATTSDGSAIVWYDSPINGNIVSNPTLNSVGTVTYYAEAQNSILNCISATRTPVTLTINPAPAAPSGEATQSICSVATVVFTLSDLVVNGTNLQWYADENLTTPLPSNHPLTHNITYYVTQTVSGCESITYLAVLVNLNSPITPVFDFGTEITLCSNTEFPILPTTDTNGIVGEWNPSEISSVQGNTYVFTPVNNSCATSFTLSVTLNQFQTPVFNFGNSISICSGDTPPILPDEDNNGINGFWSPATIDTTSNGTYTFIVNNSECAENLELTVIVNELIVPTFDFGSSISLCSGENVPTLPAISNNNVNGVWNPAVINNTQSG